MRKQLSLALILLVATACGDGHPPTTPSPQFLPEPSVPALVAPSPGNYKVGIHIEPGRYFSAPTFSGCQYQLEGSGGRFRASVDFAPRQLIVDILESDQIFRTDSNCGTWVKGAAQGAQAMIPPGMWVVGSQIAPGTYTADAVGECDFHRLRDFHSLGGESVIEYGYGGYGVNETVSVTISAEDIGFSTTKECGTWSRQSGSAPSPRN